MTRKEEIKKEMESISPFLANLNLRPAFKVPKGYFDDLSDSILESISPLTELKASQSFKVPQNYFESLPDLVLAKVAEQKDSSAEIKPASHDTNSWLDDIISQLSLLFQPRYALRLATLAIVLIGGFIFYQKSINTNDSTFAETETTNESLENPLAEYGLRLEDLTDEDLTMLLSESNTTTKSTELDPLLDEILENIEDVNIEDLEDFL